MRINTSFVGMESARTAASMTASSVVSGALGTQKQGSEVTTNKGIFEKLLDGWKRDGGSSLDDEEMPGLSYTKKGTYAVSSPQSDSPAKALENLRERCIMYLLELLFGIKSGNEEKQDLLAGEAAEIGPNPPGGNFRSFRYLHAETESTSFEAQGRVVTGDGREIEFGLSLEMSRSFREYYESNYSSGFANMCDPLVINLDGSIPSLSDQKFYFDLDADGEMDEISSMGRGSGFIALDKNGDGRINDGSELFGTRSGNGFADLAAYDSDGDGWIDEDDPIWDKLRIWTKDETGRDKLYTFREAGVGAICLQNASTNFSLNSLRDNHQNGQIRSTGIFLFENGQVGSVQHLDLAK